MKRLVLVAAVTVLVISHAQNVFAQINPGTKVLGAMDQSLSSKDSYVGEVFKVSDVHTTNGDIGGAVISGHVSHVQKAGQGTPGKIDLEYDTIKTRAGGTYKIVAHTTNVTVKTKSNAEKEALAAAGGALVGGLIGKGAGAVIGAAGGFLYAKNNRQDVTIPQGSQITVEITQSTHVKK